MTALLHNADVSDDLDEIRRRQIDMAWALNRPLPHAEHRRRWLAEHLLKQNGLCFYCGVRCCREDKDETVRPSLDHLVPLSKGGLDRKDNTVAACALCNAAKADMMPDEAKALLPARRMELLDQRAKRMAWRARR